MWRTADSKVESIICIGHSTVSCFLLSGLYIGIIVFLAVNRHRGCEEYQCYSKIVPNIGCRVTIEELNITCTFSNDICPENYTQCYYSTSNGYVTYPACPVCFNGCYNSGYTNALAIWVILAPIALGILWIIISGLFCMIQRSACGGIQTYTTL